MRDRTARLICALLRGRPCIISCTHLSAKNRIFGAKKPPQKKTHKKEGTYVFVPRANDDVAASGGENLVRLGSVCMRESVCVRPQ